MSTAERVKVGPAVLLVLLLSVSLTFVNGIFVRLGAPEWGVFAGRILYLGCGLLLFRTQSILPRTGRVLAFRDLAAAFALVASTIVFPLATLVWEAAQDSDLTQGKLEQVPVLLSQVVIGPAGEELVFTGFLYSTLRRRFGAPLAAVAVALLFVPLHMPSTAFAVFARLVYVFAACAVFERFRSIMLTIGLHILVNGSILVAVLLIVDRLSPVFALAKIAPAVMLCASAIALFTIYLLGWRTLKDSFEQASL